MQEANIDIALEQKVADTLLYFDIFRYPLTLSEILTFTNIPDVHEEDALVALHSLCEQKLVFHHDGFYSVQPDHALVERRLTGNKRANEIFPLACKRGRLISAFPFVRGVMVSGSLSKNYMDENSDIDFFVITAPKRLWMARLALTVFKKVFLLNSHKNFCINYFIDADQLLIGEQNLFTAMELATLRPLFGKAYYERLMIVNEVWVKKYLPNVAPADTETVPNESRSVIKPLSESLFNSRLGNVLQNWFMKLTYSRWQRMYLQQMGLNDFKIAFKAQPHVSKGHPNNFQKVVMTRFENKRSEFQRKRSNS